MLCMMGNRTKNDHYRTETQFWTFCVLKETFDNPFSTYIGYY